MGLAPGVICKHTKRPKVNQCTGGGKTAKFIAKSLAKIVILYGLFCPMCVCVCVCVCVYEREREGEKESSSLPPPSLHKLLKISFSCLGRMTSYLTSRVVGVVCSGAEDVIGA